MASPDKATDVRTGGSAVGVSRKPRRIRKRVNLTLDAHVWTLAKERWPNVSRVVESLLKVALNLDSRPLEVVVRQFGGPVAQPGMSAALARRRPRVQIPAGPPSLGWARGLDWL